MSAILLVWWYPPFSTGPTELVAKTSLRLQLPTGPTEKSGKDQGRGTAMECGGSELGDPPTPTEANCTIEAQKAVSQVFVNLTTIQTQLPHDGLLLFIGFPNDVICIMVRSRIEVGGNSSFC